MCENFYTFVSDEGDERLDVFLAENLESSSRTFIQKLIKEGNVKVNDEVIKKASFNISEDDKIEIIVPKPIPLDVVPVDIPLNIMYEDDDVLIVNKPKGMVVHPAAGHFDDTLVNALLFHCKDSLSGINGIMRPGIVHRIDMDTSGSLIICKNDIAHADIAEQLRNHSINRIYVGIVNGRLSEKEGCVDLYMSRDSKDRKKMGKSDYLHGKHAVTHYKVLEEYNNYSLCEFKLETGRTHQIRFAMSYLKHPLLGDYVYGPENNKFGIKGQMLHAKTIGFVHPKTKEYMEFEAPLPEEFIKICDIIKKGGF